MSNAIVFAVPASEQLMPAPIPAHWIVEGAPQAYSKRLASSADGTSSIMAWSCTPGRFNWHYAVDETLHIISGEVFVTDEDGASRRLGPGDVVFFPAGSSSLWHVTEEVRKLAFCRQSMPRPFGFALRAWNKLGNMLSSIFGLSADDGDPLESRPDERVEPERATAA
ncbi:MAG: cupin domain-containing protein [Xanthobacteraceae bacterium]|jgi:uncharacterized cupin superfamily protein